MFTNGRYSPKAEFRVRMKVSAGRFQEFSLSASMLLCYYIATFPRVPLLATNMQLVRSLALPTQTGPASQPIATPLAADFSTADAACRYTFRGQGLAEKKQALTDCVDCVEIQKEVAANTCRII